MMKVLSLLAVGSMLLVSTASALTDEAAAQRWNELQATGINNAERIIQNLYAADDLTDAELLQVVLTAPGRDENLKLLFTTAKSRGQLQGAVDAAVASALSDASDLSMEQVLAAADAAGSDVLELTVVTAIKRGGTGVLVSALLQSQVVAEAALPQYLIENGASPNDVQSALQTGTQGAAQKTIKPDRVSVSPVN